MGVPISFLHKYNPEQFEIIGICRYLDRVKYPELFNTNWNQRYDRCVINGEIKQPRVFIKNRNPEK